MFQSYLCTNPSDNISNVIIGDAQPRAQRIWIMLNLHFMACPVLLHSSSWVDIPKVPCWSWTPSFKTMMMGVSLGYLTAP